MREYLRVMALAAALVCVCASVPAARAAPAEQGRFSMLPVEDGILRLDTFTGAMALCQRRDGAWTCKSVEEKDATRSGELDRLLRENERLRAENRRLRSRLDGFSPDERGEEEAQPDLPSEEEIDRMMSLVERFLRRFKEMIDSLEQPDERETSL